MDSLKGSYYDYSIRFISFEPLLETTNDTVEKDSLIKAIETYGEEEEEESNFNLAPTVEDNVLPPSTPDSNLAVIIPSNKVHVLWFGIVGIILLLISVFRFKLQG